MTEEQIERHVQRRTDEIDRQYMAGAFTEAAYGILMRALSDWADRQYRVADKPCPRCGNTYDHRYPCVRQ